VDRSIYTAASQKRAIGRIHNGIHLKRGDVVNDDLNHFFISLFGAIFPFFPLKTASYLKMGAMLRDFITVAFCCPGGL
jgi:hypothetical protein